MASRLEYLLAIYIEERRDAPPVSFDRIAEMLDRSPATVTEMCQRLDEKCLVRHDRYEGVTLTDEGQQRAEAYHERYVILSWFFRSVLDLEEYEREAMEMAGAVSPETADRLADTLPYTDSTQASTDLTQNPASDDAE